MLRLKILYIQISIRIKHILHTNTTYYKPNFKEGKWLAQDHMANKCENNDSNTGLSSSESRVPLYLKYLEI